MQFYMQSISKRIRHKKRLYTLLIFITLLGCGAVWQSIMQDKEMKEYKPVGTIIQVAEEEKHVYVKGNGDTCYVFIAGSGTPCAYTDFYGLQNAFSQYGKTITYDHTGFGWSEKTKNGYDVDNLAEELDTILTESDAGENCILICHSLGSLEGIRFAQLYPEKVKGIIFLDSGSPEFYAKDSEIKSYFINRGCAMLRVTGINRFIGLFGIKLPLLGENARMSGLPSEIKGVEAAMYYRYLGNTANIENILKINENAEMVLEGGRLDNIPILVLSSDSGAKWEKTQKELGKWSNDAKQITIKGAAHYLHWTNQEEIIEEIQYFTDEMTVNKRR